MRIGVDKYINECIELSLSAENEAEFYQLEVIALSLDQRGAHCSYGRTGSNRSALMVRVEAKND